MRPSSAEEKLRVVLVIDVPADAPGMAARTAELADEYARVIAQSIPGVRPHDAVVEGGRVAAAPAPKGLLIDDVRRHVLVDGGPVRLAYREFELLRYLARRPGLVVSREELVREVWHDAAHSAAGVSVRTVDAHVRRLRVKLVDYQDVLTSVRGRGYRFEPRPDVRVMGMRDASGVRSTASR